jgi:methylisocitrate lyase
VTALSPTLRLREIIARPQFTPALGIWDPFTARLAQSMGMECLHLGGYQLGAHYVTPEPLLTLTEVATSTRYITSAISVPLIVDVGAGFGEPLHVMRCVREIEKAGGAAIQIEDQIYPKRAHYHKGVEHVIPRDEMVAKIKAACAARRDPNFVIVGRTDAMRTDGYAEGLARANLYFAAGADVVMIFPNTLEEARAAPREINGPLAYTNSEGNRLPRPTFTVKEYDEMGYRLASYPTALLCPAMQEMKRIIANIKFHGESGMPRDKMVVWRKEVEDLIGLEEAYRIEEETVER